MVFIDIHAHLEVYPPKKISKIIDNAKKSNISIILNAASCPKSLIQTINLSNKYPEIKPVLGIYPTDALSLSPSELETQISLIKKSNPIAIGEVGLDLKESSDLNSQLKTLNKFITLAKELNIPLIIHSRKAELQAIETLEKSSYKKIIMHCFSGKQKLVQRIIDNGWYFSIPSNIKNSPQFQYIAKHAPLTQLFCETDTPFLHPLKEKNNEPANVIYAYKEIAKIKNLTLKQVETQIEKNFKKLFYK